jgi:hypothetical protein
MRDDCDGAGGRLGSSHARPFPVPSISASLYGTGVPSENGPPTAGYRTLTPPHPEKV